MKLFKSISLGMLSAVIMALCLFALPTKCFCAGNAGDSGKSAADPANASNIEKLRQLQTEGQVEQERLTTQIGKLEAAKSKVASSPAKVQRLQAAIDQMKAKYDELRRASQIRAKELEKAAGSESTPSGNWREAHIVGLTGEVNIRRQGEGAWASATDKTTIKPGDEIRTGASGRVQFSVVGKNEQYDIVVNENTDFVLEKEKEGLSHDMSLKMGKIRAMYKYLTQDKSKESRIPMRILSKGAVAAVRGTEFEFQLDDSGLTHLTPYSGTIELTAEPQGIERGKVNRWFEKGLPQTPPSVLPAGKWSRVAYVYGDVKIEGVGKSARRAAVGNLLSENEKLITGKDGLAYLELRDGYVSSLAANGRLEPGGQEKSVDVLCMLRKGLCHVLDKLAGKRDKSTGARFATPSTVTVVRGTEFEVSVAGDGLSDYMIFDGVLEVSAK